MARLSDDLRIVALLIAWFFVCFLEGAAGFGTPVALAAPLLVTVGFTSRAALLLALVGNAAAVPFGAIGTPMVRAPLLARNLLLQQAAARIVPTCGRAGNYVLGLVIDAAEPRGVTAGLRILRQ